MIAFIIIAYFSVNNKCNNRNQNTHNQLNKKGCVKYFGKEGKAKFFKNIFPAAAIKMGKVNSVVTITIIRFSSVKSYIVISSLVALLVWVKLQVFPEVQNAGCFHLS